LLDDAEESECKESMLAYYFLLAEGGALTAEALDSRVENWLAETWECRIDFEINDALDKLSRLGLAQQVDGSWLPRRLDGDG
jgi:hypothetical protein